MRADYTYWFKGQLKVLRRCAQDVADSMAFHDVKIADKLRQIEYLCNQAETEIDQKAGKLARSE